MKLSGHSTSTILTEVDTVQITIIMDNTIDALMAGTSVAKRWPLGSNPFAHSQLIAEHGFSALIKVQQGVRRGTVLFDAGVSRTGILHNMDVLEIQAQDVQAIIVSHGHADHVMGLPGLIDRLGTRSLPLILHPDVYLERRLALPNGVEVALPPPRRADLQREYIELIEEVHPSLLIDNMILVSGEVLRTVPFEIGFPGHQARRRDTWESDALILDDQCAIMHVRDRGLVIVTGCGHSGIINVIRTAQFLTGVRTVYAVIGGFHLSGAGFEPRIAPTLQLLQEIGPQYIVPGHCTGWRAIHQIARVMPDAFIATSVGTTFVF